MNDVYEYLNSTARFGAVPGLHRIRALLGRLGNPEKSIPRIIHVGGTNGKGSVTAYVSSILTAAGHRVGRFTSPHLFHPRERIAIDGEPVSPGELASLLESVKAAAGAVAAELGDPPTYFEVLTAAMYLWARQSRVDWLVQEVGLGGRWDATNVIATPELAIITRVDLDHTDRLGNTVAAIAADKAHIIKPGGLVLTGAAGDALEAIKDRAGRVGARSLFTFHPTAGDYTFSVHEVSLAGTRFTLTTPAGESFSYRTPALGEYAAVNAAMAAAAAHLLRNSGLLDAGDLPAAIAGGLAATRWPGRMHWVPGDPPVLVDGAHNRAAMEALRKSARMLFPGRPFSLLTALSGGRDAGDVMAPWLDDDLVHQWAVVPLENQAPDAAGRAAGRLREMGAQPVKSFDAIVDGWDWLRQGAPDDGIVVVCGSLHLAGAVLKLLGATPTGAANPANRAR